MDPDPPPSPPSSPSPSGGPPSLAGRLPPPSAGLPLVGGLPPAGGLPPPPDDGPGPEWLAGLRARVGLDGRAVAWVVAAVVAVAVGAWMLRPAGAAVEETLPMASSTPAGAPADGAAPPGEPGGAGDAGAPSSSTSEPAELVVHAAGAVAEPGVYTLPPTARVDDLVRAAGGLAPDADGSRINLAAPLADGARVYVPRVGEEVAPEVVGPDGGAPLSPSGTGSPDGSPGDGPDALIDLNTATEEELDELPGVGPAIAAAIVAFREENGGFQSVDDLLDVRGIGEAKLADIRPLVTV